MFKIIEHFFGKREQKRERVREGRGRVWESIAQVKRIIIDGVPYLVRDIISITPDEVVVIDLDGTMKTIKRGRKEVGQSSPIGYVVSEEK